MSLKFDLPEIEKIDREAQKEAREHLDSLLKPKGSLGRLEELCIQIAGIKAGKPQFSGKKSFVLCGDHGITEEGVSAYPEEVTGFMAEKFVEGGTAINVLAEKVGSEVEVVDMGVKNDIETEEIIDKKIDYGTGNFRREPAMTKAQAKESIKAGIEIIKDHAPDEDLIGLGEMGIGNSSASAAMMCCLYELEPEDVVGSGTGLEPGEVEDKVKIIRESLRERDVSDDPLDVLSKVGGFEIGGLTGMIIGGASEKKLMLVDGYISMAAAALAIEIEPRVEKYLVFSHHSGEKGFENFMDELDAEPLLKLGMKLGEGTGSALAIDIVEAAVKVYNEMSTLEEAGISEN